MMCTVPVMHDQLENAWHEFWRPGEAFARNAWLKIELDGRAEIIGSATGARDWTKRGHLASPLKAPRA
jgi:hypothetical protein